jgi:putative ABC transport system ATP-binding protein
VAIEPNLVVRDVHKGYGTGRNHVSIVRGISLEVVPGETLYLVGPSGSGKTTLLSLMGCILTPDKGSVRVQGYEVTRMSSAQLTAFRRKYLSFIFQSFNLFPNLSALDNIRLTLCMQGWAERKATTRAIELLDQVGLSHRARLRPNKLSTGECQRVAVARALADEPAILFADEPTASLDAENGQAIMRLLKRLAHDRSVTLVIVTHDNRILPFADRIIRLEDGRVTHSEEVRHHPSPLVAEFLGPRVPPPANGHSHSHGHSHAHGHPPIPAAAPAEPPQLPPRSRHPQTAFTSKQIIITSTYPDTNDLKNSSIT